MPGGTELRRVCRPCPPPILVWLLEWKAELPPADCRAPEWDVFSCRELFCWAEEWAVPPCWLLVCWEALWLEAFCCLEFW